MNLLRLMSSERGNVVSESERQCGVRVSEAERLSEDALFLGEKAVYQDLF